MMTVRTERKLFVWSMLALALFVAAGARAQQSGAASSRVMGTVTAVNGNSVSVKTDSGTTTDVTVADGAKIVKTAPGQKTLQGATAIPLSDVSAGDRVLMLVAGDPPAAKIVVVNKQSDLAAMHDQEQAEWQQHGVGGLVKSVDAASGTLTVAQGSRTITIHATPKTVVRRYAPDSVKFSDAQPSTLAAIQPGDQVQARGEKNPDGSEVTAQEIVSGAFRNIAGTVTSVDAGAGTIRVKDLATKKEVTIRTTPDSDLRKIEPQMAQMIAMRLKAGGGQGAGAEHPGGGGSAGQNSAGQGSGGPGGQGGWHRGAGSAEETGSGAGNGSAPSLARVLQRSPEIHVGDLHKGDAVMIVATSGNPAEATAIRLVAGVEPMLEASASGSQSMLSSAWSLGGGSGGDQGGDQ